MISANGSLPAHRYTPQVTPRWPRGSEPASVVWVCVFGLGFRLRPATPGWGVGLCVCSACTQPLLATGARCGCVCLGSGFGCAPPLVAGVLGCVRAPLATSHSWPRVRGVGVCVWARVLAAPRHSWLGCWAVCVLRLQAATPGHGCAVWVCVFGLGFRLGPATPGWGVGLCLCSACTQPLLATGARCGCVCLGSGFGCAPPLVAGVLGCVRAPRAPSHSWHVCAVWVCVFGLGFRLRPATRGWDVGLCVCSACTQPLLATGARRGCVCLGSGFGCAPPLLAGVLGCVCAPLAPSHSWLYVSLGAVLCVPCPLRSVRCCASLCWCACAVLFVWCVLLLAPGAVVRCRVLCCFLWCAVVRCWVWWPVVVCWCHAVAPCCLFCFVGGAGLCPFPVCAVLCCAARRVVRFRMRLRCCWCLVLWRVPVCCGVSLGVLRCGGAALVCRGVLLCCALSCGVLRLVPLPAVLCCLAVLCWWAVLCGCLRCWCFFSCCPLFLC